MEYESKEQPATLIAAMAKLELTIHSTFVPWSQSRNKGEKEPSLNWRVVLKHKGREILTTDYMAGSGHAPSYKQHWGKRTSQDNDRDLMVRWECENGRKATGVRWTSHAQVYGSTAGPHLQPKAHDVVHSLVSDGDAIDSSGFEDWASNFGYDLDSRKAEQIYRACLDIGLKLRAALGDEGWRELQEACQDY
jgi:hypothetical protein